MLFTEENIKKYNLVLKNNRFYDIITKIYYYYHYACNECGYPFIDYAKIGECCTRSCSKSGKRHHFYGKKRPEHSKKLKRDSDDSKCGKKYIKRVGYGSYTKNNIPTYDTYTPQLEPYEECRRNTDDPNILEVKCTYCGKWYGPKGSDVRNRITGINKNDIYRLYCSDNCKIVCPLFHRGAKSLIKRDMIAAGNIIPEEFNREVQPELRKIVLANSDYTCEICGITDVPLHCHHIEPIKLNPIESADVDNCLCLCVECHKSVHKLPGCTYNELANCDTSKN